MADLNTINDLINYIPKVRKKAETYGDWLNFFVKLIKCAIELYKRILENLYACNLL